MKKAIVCVDDEVLHLMGMKAELHRAFGERFIYKNVFDALEVPGLIEELQEKGIEIVLIVTDLNMPGIRGDALLKKLWEQNLEIPAIIVTGEEDFQLSDFLQKKGLVRAIIQKPLKNGDFISTVKIYLEK